MKSLNRIALALVSTIFLFAVPAFAQAGGGMGQGQGMRMNMPRYDASTVVTVKGTVQDVQEGISAGRMRSRGGLHLLLKTDTESYTVLVGPAQFVKDKGFTFAKDDAIEVTGSKVKFNDKDAIIAREIKKADKTLTLRDEKGVPAWSMGRRP
jgi:DNA/RNA endonuclease YhcR with UshA esterase domain